MGQVYGMALREATAGRERTGQMVGAPGGRGGAGSRTSSAQGWLP